MTALQEAMKIHIENLELARSDRLRERLEIAARLRCTEHAQPIFAVSIHGLENGWFDAQWTTCCEKLAQQAVAIVKDRC